MPQITTNTLYQTETVYMITIEHDGRLLPYRVVLSVYFSGRKFIHFNKCHTERLRTSEKKIIHKFIWDYFINLV